MTKQIRKEVMRRYPKTEKEKQGCLLEIERRKGLRNEYRKRLENAEGRKVGGVQKGLGE